MKYAFALVFSGLTAAALAGAPPQDAACGCKMVKAVVVEAPSCSAEAKSCSGASSCSGRRTFAQRRADRIKARCAARQARAEARSCSGSQQPIAVVICDECE